MIKSKFFDRIVITFICIAIVFTLILTYFPGVFNISASSGAITKQYESALFDSDTIMTVDIQMSQNEWDSMLENAMNEEYSACDIVVNGTTYKNVGIRPKGNTSLSQIVSDDTTDRYSFKIEFDHYNTNQSLLGLDKLVLNNIMSDTTYMKEYITYNLLEYMDVVSSLYSYAQITVNGEPWGLYLALEGMEESFAERNYGSSYGQLYKPESINMGGGDKSGGNMNPPEGMSNMQGFPPDFMQSENSNNINSPDKSTTNNTETEEQNVTNMNSNDRNAIGSDMNGTNNTIDNTGNNPIGNDTKSSGGTSGDINEEASNNNRPFGGGGFGGMGGGGDLKYIDDEIDSYSTIFESSVFDSSTADHKRVIEALKNISDGTELEKYIDVDATLRYFAVNTFIVNLDSYVSNLQHNYYLYESDGQLTMLPWDFNLAFAGFQSNDAESAVNFPIDTPVSGVSLEDRPILGKLLEVDEYKELYHEYLDKIVTEYIGSGQFDVTVEKVTGLISDSVKNDATAFYTYEEYEKGVETLKNFCYLRAESVKGQLDGTIPSTEEGQQGNKEALIDASSITISDMGTQGGGRMGGDRGEMNAGFGGFPGGNGNNGENAPSEGNQANGEGVENAFPEGNGDNVANEESGNNNSDNQNAWPAMGQMQQGQQGFPMGNGREPMQSQSSMISKEQVILLGVSVLTLAAAIPLVAFFKRRRYRF